MKIHTNKLPCKVGTVPWGACRVRGTKPMPEVGDTVWVQKRGSNWSPWIKCRVYEVIDGHYLKVLYFCDDITRFIKV
jgi:hypothetical protein